VTERLSRREIEARIGAVDRIWGPRATVLTDGPRRGRRQITVTTAAGLDADLDVDQFLDIGRTSWHGIPVSFTPAFTGDGGADWLRRWSGGLLTTCGLHNVGPAQADGAGMHGRAGSIAAAAFAATSGWNDDRYVTTVRGTMREAVPFGDNLTVERTIRVTIGEPLLSITDVIRNEAFRPDTVLLLYHINLGWPLVMPGARIDAPQWTGRVEAPSTGATEQVDRLPAAPDNAGWSTASISSDHLRCRVSWRAEQLPYFTLWRSVAAGSYAVGLEPGTCWPGGAATELAAGRGRTLRPGEEFATERRIQFAGCRECLK
jgi:hypothetical protein